MSRILIAGATGFAGGAILKAALADPEVLKVTVLVRRALPADPERTNEDKLDIHIVEDFAILNWSELSQNSWWSELTGVAWALGNPIHKTNLKLPEYEKMTIDWPVACASRLPLNTNFLFVTGMGVMRKGDAWGPGAATRNVKGRAESQLLELSNLAGHLVVARPGGITQSALLAAIAPSFIIPLDVLALFIVEATKKGVIDGRVTWESKDMLKYGQRLEKRTSK